LNSTQEKHENERKALHEKIEKDLKEQEERHEADRKAEFEKYD